MPFHPLIRRPSAKKLKAAYQAKFNAAPPPASKTYQNNTDQPVVAIPEYGDMGGVLISYPGTVAPPTSHTQLVPSGQRAFGIPNELIVRMQQNENAKPVHIFVMCDDTSAKAEIDASLSATAKALGLVYNPDHLYLVPWDTDTYWTRDYGPWWVKNVKTGSYGIAKHVYTTLGGGSVGFVEGAESADPHLGSGIFRPNDDYGAVAFSDFLNSPIRAWNTANWAGGAKLPPLPVHDWFFTGLLDVGGNYMVTGQNVIASSYLVATQNELPLNNDHGLTDPTPADIENRMVYILEQLNRFMGIKTYHVLTDPTGTYIGHIDCWGKFLADDKILIAQAQDAETNKAFDAIADSFAQQGFQVFRVMVQNIYIPNYDGGNTTAAYSNSLILNDHVYVPIAGTGYEDFDAKALAVYAQALPDHKIVGIPSKPGFPWLGTDAMHCRTRGVPRAVVETWLAAQTVPPSPHN